MTATFVADGGAIAPGALVFGPTPVHVDTHNAQQVTLQNCGSAPFQLDAPQVPVPFSIDSPNFPTALNPGEITTFSVGFHPTKIGNVSGKALSITSPQLHEPLTVDLSGEGVARQRQRRRPQQHRHTHQLLRLQLHLRRSLGGDRGHLRGARRPRPAGAATHSVIRAGE